MVTEAEAKAALKTAIAQAGLRTPPDALLAEMPPSLMSLLGPTPTAAEANAQLLVAAVQKELADLRGAQQKRALALHERMYLPTERAWRAGHAVHREVAKMRDELWTTTRVVDWYSELVGDPAFIASCAGDAQPVQSAVMAWTSSRLRAVAASPSWFSLAEPLAWKLLATDLRGATIADLRLPLPAFYVELPSGVLALEDSATGWHELRVLAICRGAITEQTVQIARAMGDTSADRARRGPRLLVVGYGSANQRSANLFDDAWLFENFFIGDEHMGVELAAKTSGIVDGEIGMRCRVGERVLDGVAEMREVLLRLALNLCIYLGSERGSVRHRHVDELQRLLGGKKFKNLRGSVQRKVRALELDRIFDVGTDVTIDAELREAVRREGIGQKLAYRTLVRGHWRNQAHGPGHALRRQRWIEPHIRGADLPGPVAGHNYDVKP